MRKTFVILLFSFLTFTSRAQAGLAFQIHDGYRDRLKAYVDTLTVFDTHEHLVDPVLLSRAGFLDFAMMFLENGYNDLVSSGMSDTLFSTLFSSGIDPASKWRIMEPFWQKSFNTSNNRILLKAINDIYGEASLDQGTATSVSLAMKKNYGREWFDHIIRDMCRIDYMIIDGRKHENKSPGIRYAERFEPWIQVRSKYTIDSVAILQVDPIFTLEDFVQSMAASFGKALNDGMAAVKIDMAYDRTLSVDRVTEEAARKVFRTLVNGDEDTRITYREAKPLQDYMIFKLLSLAGKYDVPVAFHTGFQSGNGNLISNSDPSLLSSLFLDFPGVRFVLFHGAYPYGGELSVLAKNFRNVYIDMNWTYDISPAYASRFLDEWLETVPVGKIMAFGGDQRMPEMTYGSLVVARNVVADVIISKVEEGYFSEEEAKVIAKMLLHDNGMNFYRIR